MPSLFDSLTCELATSWRAGQIGRIWLMQPSIEDFAARPRLCHPATSLDALRRMIAAHRGSPSEGPSFFVVPELTLPRECASDLNEIRRDLRDGEILVAGMGQHTAVECDDYEPGVSDSQNWRDDPRGNRLANVALVAARGVGRIQGKCHESQAEQGTGQHLAHARLIRFEGNRFAFLVVICSELQTSAPREVKDTLARASENVDFIFWLQHEANPLDSTYQDSLRLLFSTDGRRPVVVCANKRATARNSGYGCSGLIVRRTALPAFKKHMPGSHWVLQPVDGLTHVARTVFHPWDAEAYRIDLPMPKDVPSSSGEARRMIPGEVRAYAAIDKTLQEVQGKAHISRVFDEGLDPACKRLGKPTSWDLVTPARAFFEREFAGNPPVFLNFLDTALEQRAEAHRQHPNHESHQSDHCCSCWPHRARFEWLYQPASAEAVAELTLAAVALGGAVLTEAVRIAPPNLRTGCGHKLILAWSNRDWPAFEAAHFDDREAFVLTSALVLRSQPLQPIAGIDAAAVPPTGALDGASNRPPVRAVVFGGEFWEAYLRGADRAQELLASRFGACA